MASTMLIVENLEELIDLYKRWLYLEETEDIEVALATLLDREIPGDPIWLQIIASSGDKKTEILRSFKDYNKAYKAYLDLLKMAPDDPKVYNSLGMISYFRGDFRKAIEYLSKETELHSNRDSDFILGMAYGKLEEYQKAVEYLKKYLDSLPAGEKEKRKRAESALLLFKSKL